MQGQSMIYICCSRKKYTFVWIVYNVVHFYADVYNVVYISLVLQYKYYMNSTHLYE